MREESQAELRETTKRKLNRSIGRAADAWERALDKAADKGDYKPAKDLLLHTKTIEPLNDSSTGVQMIVCRDARSTGHVPRHS